ncbi:hypothetical protein BJV77DRAFT_169612 [Russula vinacea]|nr:hypothetical protein BJV77DRAFT_169612 [Russula vinacea]
MSVMMKCTFSLRFSCSAMTALRKSVPFQHHPSPLSVVRAGNIVHPMSFVITSSTVAMNSTVIVLTFGMIRFTILYGERRCVIFALTPPIPAYVTLLA